MTVSELLRTGTEKLKSVGIDDAELMPDAWLSTF